MPNNFDSAIGAALRWKKGQASPNPGGRPKSRLLSSALGAKLAEIKPDDREGRTCAEVVATNLIAIACSQGHSAVTAAEIANRLEGRPSQRVGVSDITADLAQRSDEELRYYLLHHYLLHQCWPNGEETPGSVGDHVEAKDEWPMVGGRLFPTNRQSKAIEPLRKPPSLPALIGLGIPFGSKLRRCRAVKRNGFSPLHRPIVIQHFRQGSQAASVACGVVDHFDIVGHATLQSQRLFTCAGRSRVTIEQFASFPTH
jgi:Family of unknown function (DUF5681)